MATNRVEILKSLLAQNPTDSFARYGLAMEHVKAGELEQAVHEFHTVIANNPKYTYAYFHGGQALEKLGRVDDARAIYETGIEISAKIGDNHALSELRGALDLL